MESNHRPHAYQACALTIWAMSPYFRDRFYKIYKNLVLLSMCFLLFHELPSILQCTKLLFHKYVLLIIILLTSDFIIRRNFKVHWKINNKPLEILLRKEVIQPHLPIRLPCYDFTPIIDSTFDCCLLAVGSQASGIPNSHGVTGGVYKARERIHGSMLTCHY